MSELTTEKVETELAMVNLVAHPRTLDERREDIRTRLHTNRRVLEHKLLHSQGQHFPRSTTMRFLSNQSARHFLNKFAKAGLGFQAFKSLRYGFSLWQFARSAYSAFKATRNVVKAKEGKPTE
jgi:hypothetical protein